MSHSNQVLTLEQDVVLQAQKDPAAFEPLYQKYHLQIYKYVYLRMPTESDSKEVTALTFEKAIVNLNKYKSKGFPFSSWLYSIARNEVSNFYRRVKKDKITVISEREFANLGEQLNDSTQTPLREEQLQKVLPILETLTEEEVELIELKYFELRPYKEISEITGLSEANARVKIHRIVQQIKNKLS